MIPPRRRRSFSLRTLFVVVTIAGIALGLYPQFKWIRERHGMLDAKLFVVTYKLTVPEGNASQQGPRPVRAPGILWLLGEPGVETLAVNSAKEQKIALDLTDEECWNRAKRLFPEAELFWAGHGPRPQ